jgi:hypothetical protein
MREVRHRRAANSNEGGEIGILDKVGMDITSAYTLPIMQCNVPIESPKESNDKIKTM